MAKRGRHDSDGEMYGRYDHRALIRQVTVAGV